MNKTTLTLLSCSSSLAIGSLAIVLSLANLAEADTTQPNTTSTPETAGFVDITFSAPQASATRQNATPLRSADPRYANLDPASDTVGDLAIAKLRCDCNACRNAVVQLLQSGQLTL